jgi:hypothetical protein
VVVVATPFASATGLSAVPSTVNVTVPVGAVVPEVWATVAVSVTVTPVAGLEGETATGSCEEIGPGTNTITVTNALMAIDCG